MQKVETDLVAVDRSSRQKAGGLGVIGWLRRWAPKPAVNEGDWSSLVETFRRRPQAGCAMANPQAGVRLVTLFGTQPPAHQGGNKGSCAGGEVGEPGAGSRSKFTFHSCGNRQITE